MRRLLADLSYVVGLAAAAGWAYYLWGYPWITYAGRAFGLWLLGIGVGTPIVFMIAFGLIALLHASLFPDRH